MKVLIVEDDRIAALAATAILSNAGFTVDAVTNSDEALIKVRSFAYQLIFMDIGLGHGMDGAITAREVRKVEKKLGRSASQIIALTSQITEKDTAYYTNMGMDDVIQKPLVPDVLESHILTKFDPYAEDTPDTSDPYSKLDMAKLAEMLNNDFDAAKELADQFLQDLPGYRIEFTQHYRAKNYNDLIALIQKLAGGAQYVGASKLCAAAEQLIANAKANLPFDHALYKALVDALDRLVL